MYRSHNYSCGKFWAVAPDLKLTTHLIFSLGNLCSYWFNCAECRPALPVVLGIPPITTQGLWVFPSSWRKYPAHLHVSFSKYQLSCDGGFVPRPCYLQFATRRNGYRSVGWSTCLGHHGYGSQTFNAPLFCSGILSLWFFMA